MDTFLKEAFGRLSLELTDEQAARFLKYKNLMLEWNEKVNLTAITDEREIVLKHFVDSVSISSFYDLSDKKIIDVGTGAGFPGLPLKIMNEGAEIILLDSLNKRINFLEEVIRQLELPGISCVHKRAEEAGREVLYREQFDVSTARAVSSLAVLSEYCLPFVKVGGVFIAMKGPDVSREIDEAQNAIKLLGGELSDVTTFNFPFSDIRHSIIFVKKIRQTQSKYPRISNKIMKKPLK